MGDGMKILYCTVGIINLFVGTYMVTKGLLLSDNHNILLGSVNLVFAGATYYMAVKT